MPADLSRSKILVVGPSEAGKSIISNVLSEASEVASEVYRPTVGVRILEFESEAPSSAQRLTVELWDVSGDQSSAKCWPAIKSEAIGVVLVYNPEKPNHDTEADQWYGWFPRQMNLSPGQVMVVQSMRRGISRRMPLPPKITQVGVTHSVAVQPDDLPMVRKTFGTFLESARKCVMDKQRQEEEDVMTTQVG
eukprot:TRINITY_DN60735_c0_g1_i1.p1 TRINITY_DN60735_c0_g1~~TRINITY_DN60735_c0_g1_i1.p1  ORF type:complete len:192 (-),score=43.55 TRINITY_DN60735_c0_g1_i1:121-696(-)